MIVGISGKKFSGKDTFADRLVEKFDFERLEYAARLKVACSEAFDYPLEWNYDFEEKEKSRGNRFILTKEATDIIKRVFKIPEEFKFKIVTNCWFDSVREVLQCIGTDYLRNQYDQDIHIKMTFEDLDKDRNYVVVGVRFDNESNSIKKLGGQVVYINSERGVTMDSHESENSLREYDYTIENNSTLDDFYINIDSFILEKYIK